MADHERHSSPDEPSPPSTSAFAAISLLARPIGIAIGLIGFLRSARKYVQDSDSAQAVDMVAGSYERDVPIRAYLSGTDENSALRTIEAIREYFEASGYE